jgi:hypothetical protein
MDDDARKMARNMMAGLMKKMLQHSPINVPQPLPLIEEKAKTRLSTDGLISWKIILKEWEKVSPKDKKVISSLLTLNSFDLIETFDVTSNLLEEQKATADYVREHPEYGKSEEEIKAGLAAESFDDLFKD